MPRIKVIDRINTYHRVYGKLTKGNLREIEEADFVPSFFTRVEEADKTKKGQKDIKGPKGGN